MARRILPLLLALTVLVFSACGANPQTHGELTIRLGDEFVDLSGESFAKEYDFLYQGNGVAVAGIRETRSALAAYYGDLDAAGYAALLMQLHEIPGTPTQKDGIWNFSYEAVSAGTQMTYLCAVYETQESFWLVQAYCPTADYNAQAMWNYVSAVSLDG